MTEHKTETYFKMLREMRDVVFSTVAEDGTPRARIIDVMLAEEPSPCHIFGTIRTADLTPDSVRRADVFVKEV